MTTSLEGKRILIVEDEYFIASDLKRALEKIDVAVVGPVGNLDGGLTLAENEPLDAAVLDVNLDDTLSYPIADRLASRQVPCIFLTGYDGWALPEPYRSAPRVAKPFAMSVVVNALEQLVTTGS